jgi:hypothetical protein
MHGEMPGFFPGRPGGERDEPLLDMILERRPIPPGAPPEIHGLARMLAAAAGPAEPGELAGQNAALVAFTRLASPVGTSPAAPRSVRRLLPERSARGRLPLAAAVTAVAAGLGSTAAAYAGVLPSPIQNFAHVTIGAPAPPHDFSRRFPAVASSPAQARHEPATSGPPKTPTAASSVSARGKATRGTWRYGLPGYSPGPSLASCLPTPSPSPNPVRPILAPPSLSPTQSPGGLSPPQNPASPESGASGWATPSPTAPACLRVPTQTAVPRPGR